MAVLVIPRPLVPMAPSLVSRRFTGDGRAYEDKVEG
jgi:hypothetical protein